MGDQKEFNGSNFPVLLLSNNGTRCNRSSNVTFWCPRVRDSLFPVLTWGAAKDFLVKSRITKLGLAGSIEIWFKSTPGFNQLELSLHVLHLYDILHMPWLGSKIFIPVMWCPIAAHAIIRIQYMVDVDLGKFGDLDWSHNQCRVSELGTYTPNGTLVDCNDA